MNKEILRLAIPNILSNISVPLISSVDTFLMGQLSAAHVGAVGVGSMIFNFIYWNFGFLRMGTTGITAQAYGREDKSGMMNTLGRALLVAFCLAALIMLLQMPFGKASFYLMNVSDQQYALVAEYFFIRIWAAPATLAMFAVLGWFFGMQNAIFPLLITIWINLINIGVSWYLVVHMNMDIAGVAWGTVFSQYAGLLLAITLFMLKYRGLLGYFQRQVLLQVDQLREFLVINRDIFIRTVCLTFSFGFFYSQSSSGGEIILAINVILMQFVNWMSYAVDGFAFAAESMVGKYKGAANAAKTKQSIRLAFVWGMAFAAIFSVVYGLFGTELLGIFTNDMAVIEGALPFLGWMIVFPLLGTPSYVWDGIYVGLTASKSMRDSMLLALVVYLAGFYAFAAVMDVAQALWAALMLFMVARAGFQWVLFRRKGLLLD